MKVAELEGALLDYWVAKAEGFDNAFEAFKMNHTPYSSNWAYGGLIIERAAIVWRDRTSTSHVGAHKGLSSVDGQPWEAWFCDDGPEGGNIVHQYVQTGKTMLEACMRAYVASKFGEEVEDAPHNAG